MDDLMTGRLSRWLDRLLFWGSIVIMFSLTVWAFREIRCEEADCWMTDEQREMWRGTGEK